MTTRKIPCTKIELTVHEFFFFSNCWMLNKCIKSIHALLFLTCKNWKKNLLKSLVVIQKMSKKHSSTRYLNKLWGVGVIFTRWQLVTMCTNSSMGCAIRHKRILNYIFNKGHLRSKLKIIGTVLVRIIILKADKHSLSYEWHLESKQSKNTMTAVQ